MLQVIKTARTAVTHTCAESAGELIDNFFQCPFVCNTTFNTFRNKFLYVIFHILEIAIAAAGAHGAKRTHAAILFEFSSFINNGFAGTFFSARKYASHHYTVSASRKRFYHIAGIADSAICDKRNVFLFQFTVCFHHSS